MTRKDDSAPDAAVDRTPGAFDGETLSGHSFAAETLKNECFLRCDLRHASFSGARLDGCTFAHCNLDYADFRGADLTGCDFTECSVREASFASATIGDTTRFAECDLRGATGLTSFEERLGADWKLAEDAANRAERVWLLCVPLAVAVASNTWLTGKGQFWCDARAVVDLSALPFALPTTAQPTTIGLAAVSAVVFWYMCEQYRMYYERTLGLPRFLPSGKVIAHSAWLPTRYLRDPRPLGLVAGLLSSAALPVAVVVSHLRFEEASPSFAVWAALTAPTVICCYQLFMLSGRWMIRVTDRSQGPLIPAEPHKVSPSRARRQSLVFLCFLFSFPVILRAGGRSVCESRLVGIGDSAYLGAGGWDFSGCDLTDVSFERADLRGASFDYACLDGARFGPPPRRVEPSPDGYTPLYAPMPWEFAEVDCASFAGAEGDFRVRLGACCIRRPAGDCIVRGESVRCGAELCAEQCGCELPPLRERPSAAVCPGADGSRR